MPDSIPPSTDPSVLSSNENQQVKRREFWWALVIGLFLIGLILLYPISYAPVRITVYTVVSVESHVKTQLTTYEWLLVKGQFEEIMTQHNLASRRHPYETLINLKNASANGTLTLAPDQIALIDRLLQEYVDAQEYSLKRWSNIRTPVYLLYQPLRSFDSFIAGYGMPEVFSIYHDWACGFIVPRYEKQLQDGMKALDAKYGKTASP